MRPLEVELIFSGAVITSITVYFEVEEYIIREECRTTDTLQHKYPILDLHKNCAQSNMTRT